MKRLLIIIMSLLVIGTESMPLLAESTRKERRLISEGNRLFKDSKFKEAARQYQMAVAVNPQSPEARFNLALAQLKMAAQSGIDEKQAQQYLKSGSQGMASIAAVGGSNPELASYASYNLGNVAFNSQNYQEAITCYKQALRFNPDDDTARRNLRIAQKKLQDQNKDKNKDQDKEQNKDQDKEQNKDKDKDKNKDQDKDKDKNQEKNHNKDNNKDNSMSNNTAEQILKAMENKENATRARINASGQGNKSTGRDGGRKNW